LERINIVDVWASNVTDDLTLGKVLEDEGISVELDVKNRLITPLHNQTVSAFLKFLDRQIIGPKFTNPGMWLTAIGFILGINTAALLVLINVLILYPAGYTDFFFFVASLLFIVVILLTVRLLHILSPVDISFLRWLCATAPCLAMAALSAFRSLFRSHMDWHGRRYIVGKGGKVLDITTDPTSNQL
jgi:ceramide glucosyltransferase